MNKNESKKKEGGKNIFKIEKDMVSLWTGEQGMSESEAKMLYCFITELPQNS